jgi:hypothetical protein
MKRIYVVVEGQTEEAFINRVVQPHLAGSVLVIPILLKKAGGDPRWARVKGHVVRLLLQDSAAYVSTFFDLYGLGEDFPARDPGPDPIARVLGIEAAMVAEVDSAYPRWQAKTRLLPHIQPHEFEAILFSDPDQLAKALETPAQRLHSIRRSFPSPEHINDSPQTAPSKRITAIAPGYQKVLQGVGTAASIGLPRILQECSHFRHWIRRMEPLENTAT